MHPKTQKLHPVNFRIGGGNKWRDFRYPTFTLESGPNAGWGAFILRNGVFEAMVTVKTEILTAKSFAVLPNTHDFSHCIHIIVHNKSGVDFLGFTFRWKTQVAAHQSAHWNGMRHQKAGGKLCNALYELLTVRSASQHNTGGPPAVKGRPYLSLVKRRERP